VSKIKKNILVAQNTRTCVDDVDILPELFYGINTLSGE
jgi:hypothetical protein